MEMTMMMSSTPQVPVQGNQTPGAQTAGQRTPVSGGHADHSSAFALLFAQLFGASRGTITPDGTASLLQTGSNPTDGSSGDTQAASSGKQATSQDTSMLMGNSGAAVSVMHLLNALRHQTTEGRKAGEKMKGTDGTDATDPQQMLDELEELEELLNQDGSPAGKTLEQEVAALLSKDPKEAQPQKGDGNGALESLAAVLNGALQQLQQNVVAEKKPASEPTGSSSMSGKGQVLIPSQSEMVPPQQQVMTTQNAEPSQQKTVIAADASTVVVPEQKPVITPVPMQPSTLASAQTSAQPEHHDAKAATLLQSSQLHPTQNAAAGESMKSDQPVNPHGVQVDSGKVKPDLSQIEVVFKENASQKNQLLNSDQSQAPTADLHKAALQTGSLLSQNSEGQVQQASAPTTNSGSTTLTQEQIMGQVKEKLAEHRLNPDNGQVTLKLHPAELGELKINMKMDDQRLRVEIVADNRTVKDALLQHVDSLKESLARQNISMEQFNVSTDSRQFFNQGFREGNRQEQQNAAPQMASWMNGRSFEPLEEQPGNPSWHPKENALLDMMM